MNRDEFQIEICANGVESCIAAQNAGAERVELCASIPEGGTTPSYGEIRQAREKLNKTKLHVIIRPRGGDFVYSPDELQRMTYDITMCKQLGADGVVFGCLDKEGRIDVEANKFLAEKAKGMSMTFHRAFDRCKNPHDALETVIRLGFDRILTSGQQPTAEMGIPLLRELYKRASRRIIILAGSGINEKNILKIHEETGIKEFHFSARENISQDVDDEFGRHSQTTERRIVEIIKELM